jgi:hypothetical protein
VIFDITTGQVLEISGSIENQKYDPFALLRVPESGERILLTFGRATHIIEAHPVDPNGRVQKRSIFKFATSSPNLPLATQLPTGDVALTDGFRLTLWNPTTGRERQIPDVHLEIDQAIYLRTLPVPRGSGTPDFLISLPSADGIEHRIFHSTTGQLLPVSGGPNLSPEGFRDNIQTLSTSEHGELSLVRFHLESKKFRLAVLQPESATVLFTIDVAECHSTISPRLREVPGPKGPTIVLDVMDRSRVLHSTTIFGRPGEPEASRK